MTSVVPQDREDAATAYRVGHQLAATVLGFRFGQVQAPREEQRAVLDVQRELEQCSSAEWTEYLRRSGAESDRLVEPDARIVRVAGLLQHARRVGIAQQPVHPDAGSRLTGDGGDPRTLVAAFLGAVPRSEEHTS